jgi:hypothetical protein
MRRSLAALLVLGACASPPATPGPAEVVDRATLFGRSLRAAQACGADLPPDAQDRAARIEAAAIALKQRAGGTVDRDAFLASLLPPRQRARARATWCRTQAQDISRTREWLTGPEAEAFVRAAEALALPAGR